MRQAPAAVEESRNRMRQERPPVTGPATPSVRCTISEGIRSMSSCANRQMIDGCRNN